jgi:hypothetical protein
MDKLEALISEALQKFPSEDIRELVAKETGLTVEQVSERMNEAAKAAGDSFPAETFALLKNEDITPKEVAEEDPPKPIPTITYKEVFLPEHSSSNGLSDWTDTLVTDMTIQEKTVEEGVDLLDVAAAEEFENYYIGAVVDGHTIKAVSFKSLGDLEITELSASDKLSLVNGSVIFFAPKN